MKHPVNPVPDSKLLFKRFEVDVTRPQFDRPGNDQVDEAITGPSEAISAGGPHFLHLLPDIPARSPCPR